MIRILQNEDKNVLLLKKRGVRDTYPLHCHDYYEFFLVTKGRATHIVNKSIQIVERGSLVFIRPDDAHCYDFYKSQYFEFYNLGITKELFGSINTLYAGHTQELEQSELPRHIKLNDSEIYLLEKFLTELNESEDKRTYDIKYTRILSFVIFKMLTKEEFSNSRILPDWLLYVRDEMSKKENFIVGLPRLIELSNYSQEHISREFKRYMNITPTQFINKLRLRYSHELLTTTNLEIIDICQNSGFNNLSHFYTEFKKNYNCSPNSLRKSSQKDSTDGID